MIVEAKETPYFFKEDGRLRQAVEIAVSGAGAASEVEITISAADQSAQLTLPVKEGCGNIRMVLPVEHFSGIETATVHAEGCGASAECCVVIGGYHPWTVYVAQDKHLDYGWKHTVEAVAKKMNSLVDYFTELHAVRGSRFTFDCTLWFEEYRRARPRQCVEKLAELLRIGAFEMGSMYSVLLNGIMTEEEAIQSLMPARKLELEFGIPFSSALPMEVPSLNWGLAQVLAGAGIRHVIKGEYHLNNANMKNRKAYPLFFWRGPDGSRVLVKYDRFEDTASFGGYAEARPLRLGEYASRVKHIENAVARYQGYGQYPFDMLLLAGTGWDDYPFDSEVLDFINWYGRQEWEYPKVVDSIWSDYWRQIEENSDALATLPEYCGDWGSSWEEWPAQLAYANSLYRRARETVLAAQASTALASILCGDDCSEDKQGLGEAFRNLNLFCDHNIGGILPAQADDMRDRKLMYAHGAMQHGSCCLDKALYCIAEGICGDGNTVMVFNPLSWQRDGVVDVPLEESSEYRVTDNHSGKELLCQIVVKGVCREKYLSFIARDVPAFGYRIYRLERLPSISAADAPPAAFPTYTNVLENESFKLEVDEKTGGLASLFDKKLGRELVDGSSPYCLNQFTYTSGADVYTPTVARISELSVGDACSSIVTEAETFRCHIKSIYTIYHGLHQVNIFTEIQKQPSSELQSCHFVFPFSVPTCEYHYDGMAAILKPGLECQGGNQLEGAGMGTYCGLYFADASNAAFGVTLASVDTHLYHFGSCTMGRTDGFIDPDNSTVYCVAMENYNTMDDCSSQGGQESFSFGYSILPHEGPFDAAWSLQHSRSVCSPLLNRRINKKAGAEPNHNWISIISINGKGVVASGLDASLDGLGIVLRLRECNGDPITALLSCAVRIREAIGTDHVEREIEKLEIRHGKAVVPMTAFGLRTVKLLFECPDNAKGC